MNLAHVFLLVACGVPVAEVEWTKFSLYFYFTFYLPLKSLSLLVARHTEHLSRKLSWSCRGQRSKRVWISGMANI